MFQEKNASLGIFRTGTFFVVFNVLSENETRTSQKIQIRHTANATEHKTERTSFKKAEQHQSPTLNIISGTKKGSTKEKVKGKRREHGFDVQRSLECTQEKQTIRNAVCINTDLKTSSSP